MQQASAALLKGEGPKEGAAAPHVFQVLQYMRKLCSHPLLVLDGRLPAHVSAVAAVAGEPESRNPGGWSRAGGPLRSLPHAPKLAALRELLQQCGIGLEGEVF